MANTDFNSWLKDFFEVFGITPTRAIFNLWTSCLSGYPVQALSAATQAFAASQTRGGGTILPGALIAYLPSRLNHPPAEIAWNHAPKHESDAGFVTDQIMQALGDCQSSLDRGDHIAGRVAFIESYKARVRAAEAQNIPARFWFSAPSGLSHEQRLQVKETKALEAYRNGWLTHDKAKQLVASISTELGQASPQALELIKDVVDTARLRITNGSSVTRRVSNSLPAPKSDLIDQYGEIRSEIEAKAKEQQRQRKLTEQQENERRRKLLAQASMILNNTLR